MPSLRLDIVTRSHKGLVRQMNQDAFAVDEQRGLVILADGMGGHSAGEVASRLAVQTVRRILVPALEQLEGDCEPDLGWLQEAVMAANEACLITVAEHPEFSSMGTTLVLGLFHNDRLLYAHVGDSRIYRLRNGHLQLLTRDHSLIQSMVDDGVFNTLAEARAAGVPSNMLTRGIGARMDLEVDADEVFLEPEDLFLFCTDGLTNMVNHSDMQAILFDARDDLAVGAEWLLELALANGGSDNVSLVLARPRAASVDP